MKSKAKIIAATLCLAVLFTANFASAQIVNCGGDTQNPCSFGDLINTVVNLINFLLAWAWLVALLFIVISGVRMVFAAGNEETISSAKTSLTYAVSGFVIILVSYVLINLVIGVLTGQGANLTANGFIDAFTLSKGM